MIQSDEIKLPAEFQVALYENLIRQLEKHGKFQHVFRDGDRNATSVGDLVFSIAPFEALRRQRKGSAGNNRCRRNFCQRSLSIHEPGQKHTV